MKKSNRTVNFGDKKWQTCEKSDKLVTKSHKKWKSSEKKRQTCEKSDKLV